MHHARLVGLFVLVLQAALHIRAEAPLEGYLIAERDCPTTTSINKPQYSGNAIFSYLQKDTVNSNFRLP